MTLHSKAKTPEQFRSQVVDLLSAWASNERIKAGNAIHVGVRKEAEAKANAYMGAAKSIAAIVIET